MFAVALSLALMSAPPLEGWWRPEGPDPHPSALSADVRRRLAAAVVSLGEGRSGAFVSGDGLIITSASAVQACARRLQAEGRIGPSSFIAPLEADAPVCPDLRVRMRLDSRDVRGAVEAAVEAGSTEVETALLGTCRRLGPDRRCSLVSTEEGAKRLIVEREVRRVRLRFYPGSSLGGLGGAERSFEAPWLRLDVALLSVSLGRAGAPARLRLAPHAAAGPETELWVGQHPQPDLRAWSALETLLFVDHVLPVYRSRTELLGPRAARARALLGQLEMAGPQAVLQARRRELRALEWLRGLPPDRSARLRRAFTEGRSEMTKTDWEGRAGAKNSAPEPPLFEYLVSGAPPRSEPPSLAPSALESAMAFLGHRADRSEALRASSQGPIGPGARGDFRVARGVVVASEGAPGGPTWRHLVEAARRMRVALPLPDPLPWNPEQALGFELIVDLGATVTGAPVVDARGQLLGVVSGGDEANLSGFYHFVAGGRAGVSSAHALELVLSRVFGAAGLAASMRR